MSSRSTTYCRHRHRHHPSPFSIILLTSLLSHDDRQIATASFVRFVHHHQRQQQAAQNKHRSLYDCTAVLPYANINGDDLFVPTSSLTTTSQTTTNDVVAKKREGRQRRRRAIFRFLNFRRGRRNSRQNDNNSSGSLPSTLTLSPTAVTTTTTMMMSMKRQQRHRRRSPNNNPRNQRRKEQQSSTFAKRERRRLKRRTTSDDDNASPKVQQQQRQRRRVFRFINFRRGSRGVERQNNVVESTGDVDHFVVSESPLLDDDLLLSNDDELSIPDDDPQPSFQCAPPLNNRTNNTALPPPAVDGKRYEFTASKKRSLTLSLTSSSRNLFDAYMTQPVEQYATISFYNNNNNNNNNNSEEDNNDDRQRLSRRWCVRRLTPDESRVYSCDEGDDESRVVGTTETDDYFRLAVPLMPLVGLDLTPVIDLEVISPESRMKKRGRDDDDDSHHEETIAATTMNDDKNDNDEGDRMTTFSFGRRLRNHLQRRGRQSSSNDENLIHIRSLRVSLLSTEDEVSQAMTQSPSQQRQQRRREQRKNNNDESETPSSLSTTTTRDSLRQMGYEAVGMAGKIEDYIRPQLSFRARLSWTDDDDGDNSLTTDNNALSTNSPPTKDVTIALSSTVVASFTIPSVLPFVVPGFIVRQLGTTLTERLLDVVLPRFLRQLERDFQRWASLDEGKVREGEEEETEEEGEERGMMMVE